MDSPYEFAIGSDAGSIEYLFDIPIIPPKQTYQPFSKYLQLGDGIVRGMGRAVIEWYWAYLTSAEAAALRALCPNGSAEVYVRSVDDSLTWHTYRSIMLWPPEAPDIDNDYRMKVPIKFMVIEVIS